jgi:hypothetical protein
MSSELVDPSMEMGKSKTKSLKSALVHFTNYLAYARHSKLSFDALEESDITRDIIGKFACYLMEHVPSIKKYSTSDNYLSAIHVALEMKYPAKMASLAKPYKALRDSMFAKYRKDSAESGAKFVDGAPIMTSRDLSYICRRCLADKDAWQTKKLSKLIMYLRSFSATTMLQQRPPNDDSEAKRRWAISLQSEALLVHTDKMSI